MRTVGVQSPRIGRGETMGLSAARNALWDASLQHLHRWGFGTRQSPCWKQNMHRIWTAPPDTAQGQVQKSTRTSLEKPSPKAENVENFHLPVGKY